MPVHPVTILFLRVIPMSQSPFWRFLIWFGIGRETEIDSTTQLFKEGRDEYKYVEGGRSLLVQIDMLGGRGKMLYSPTIKRWLPPHQDERISEEDRRESRTRSPIF